MRRPEQNRGFPATPPSNSPCSSSPLNPTYSRTRFRAADPAVVVSEEPLSVTLEEWWLARVEGHEQKITVAGFYERNQEVRQFTAATITKRHNPCTLETEDGIIVFIYGFFNRERTIGNGFTVQACQMFFLGFPHWWENWNERYPDLMSTQTGSQPRSSRTSNSREDSNEPSASMVGSTNVEGKVGMDNASHINKGCQKTPVVSLKRQVCLKKPQCIALHDKAVPGEATDMQSSEKGEQPAGPSRKKRSAVGKLQRASRSPNDISPISYGNLSPLARGWAKSVSVSTPESLKLKKTRSGRVVVPTLDSGCQNIVYDRDGSVSAIIGLDSPPPVQGSTLKTYARKKKRTRENISCAPMALGSTMKTYARKKKRTR